MESDSNHKVWLWPWAYGKTCAPLAMKHASCRAEKVEAIGANMDAVVKITGFFVLRT
jgi:hypothetical protein